MTAAGADGFCPRCNATTALTARQTREEIERLADDILAEPLRFLWEPE